MIDPRIGQLLHNLLTELYGDRAEVNARLAQLEAEDLLGANEHIAPEGAAEFARAWARAVAYATFITPPWAEFEQLLVDQTRKMAAALRVTPFTSQIARQVGQDLVASGAWSPEALGRTIDVIQRRFLADLGFSEERDHHRLQSFVSELAVGFAEAMRDYVFDAQDLIRRATSSAWQERETHLRHVATHDDLTGLPNRRFFIEHLTQLFREPQPAGRRLGVCFLDLDRFKSVNDTLGQSIGDLALINIARRLLEQFPEQLVARLGGDEFVILVPETECEDDAVKIADAALTSIADPMLIDHYRVQVSGSIGVVEGRLIGTDPDELMRAAEISLHWAKSDGKDRLCVFDPSRAEAELARHRLAAAMPGALDGDQFRLVYEPVVRLSDGTVCGMEAQLRWHHLQLGDVPGARFLDLAEETGFAVPLGSWALSEACQQAMRWHHHRDHPLLVCVDIGPRQLRDPGLIASVRTALGRSGMPAELLQLEVSERAVTEMDRDVLSTLSRLKETGVRLALDNFGAGYFNLAYLLRLPIEALKLHHTFATDLHTPQILSSVVRLANSLGLTVTATGVKTHEEAQLLRITGCNFGQGLPFGPPVPAEAVVSARSKRQPQAGTTESR